MHTEKEVEDVRRPVKIRDLGGLALTAVKQDAGRRRGG